MEENGLRDLLSKRLYIELQLFKDSMLQREKEDIFQSSYEIESYVNLYAIFMLHNIVRIIINPCNERDELYRET